MRTLYLIRGLPGSGKSTLAKVLQKTTGAVHFEADQYFIDENGEYDFDHRLLSDAHALCQSNCNTTMSIGLRDVVVSNTFTQRWEAKFYLDAAKVHNYAVVIIQCNGKWKSIHPVPEESIIRMRDRWENHDHWILPD